MSELKAGGLALVVGCLKNPGNIGKIVELITFMNPGDSHNGERFGGPQPGWKIGGDNLLFITMLGESKQNSKIAYAAAKHLMPINPEADPLETAQKES